MRTTTDDAITAQSLPRTITLSDEERDALVAAQNSRCPICAVPITQESLPRFRVDWDLDRNQARGLLCVPCYRSIWFMEQNPTRLRGAAAYLEAYAARQGV